MGTRNFHELVGARWDEGKFVCIGLDTEFDKVPKHMRRTPIDHATFSFNAVIVEAVSDYVCAIKLNAAFYEAEGQAGIAALSATIRLIASIDPGIAVILDVKRADIGNSSSAYARAAFEELRADAVTVNPYFGAEALKPFLDRPEKGIFVVCRTSNEGGSEFQDRIVVPTFDDEKRWGLPSGPRGESEPTHMPLYQYVAYRVSREWNEKGNCGLVVGATVPEELQKVRGIVGTMPILIPGIGAQGGDLAATVAAGKDERGKGMLIHTARQAIYASDGVEYASAAQKVIVGLHEAISRNLAG